MKVNINNHHVFKQNVSFLLSIPKLPADTISSQDILLYQNLKPKEKQN